MVNIWDFIITNLLSKPFRNMDWYDFFNFVLVQFGEKDFHVIANESCGLIFSTASSKNNISCP